ncbi:hypothetical protein DFJ73DRAFT_776429 [Zopfochytrium polystomum]|nr:hypothetical protein DFJ73DRAFT_776429 [Zopfochytrium polystomum]
MDPSEFGLTSRGEALWQIQRLNERLWRKLSWPSPGMGETAAPSSSGELMLWSLVDELVPPRGWVTGSSGYVLPVGDGIWLSLALRRRAAQDPCGSVDLLERCIYAVESAAEFMVSQSVFTATSSVRVMSLPLPHPRVWNAVLDTLMRAGHVENAFKLFDRWRGQKACTWAVTRSGESGEVRVELKPNLAGDRFSRLKQKQSKYYTQNRFVRTVQRDPDQTTYMILASGCIRNEKWEDFDNILSLARSSNKISVKESLESSDEGSSRGDAVTASILLRSQDRMHVLWDFLQVQNAMEQGHFDSAWRILRKAVERFKSAAGISLPLESASHFGGRRQQKDLALLQAATVLRECFGVMITGFAKRGFLTSVDAVLSELSDLRAASTGAAGGKKMVWSDQLALRVRNVLAFVDAFCSLNRLSDAAATLQKVFASKAESRLYDLAVGLEVLYRGCRTAVVRQRQWESTAAKELVQAESDPPGSTPARGADEVFRQSLTLFLDLVSRDIEATFPASLPTTARAAEEPTVADRRNGGGTVSGTVAGSSARARTILAMSIDPLAAAEQAVGVSFGHDGGAAGAGAARALHDSHPLDGVLVSDELLEELARAYESEGQQAEADAVRREMRWRGRRMGNDRVGNAGRGLPNLREDGAFADVMELEETLQSWSGK